MQDTFKEKELIMEQSVKQYTEAFLMELITGNFEFSDDTLTQLKQVLLLICNEQFFEDLLEIEQTNVEKESFKGIDFDEAFDLVKLDKLHLIRSFTFKIVIETKSTDKGGNETMKNYRLTIDEYDFRFFTLSSFSGAFGTSFIQNSMTEYLFKIPDEFKQETVRDWIERFRRSYNGVENIRFETNLMVNALKQ